MVEMVGRRIRVEHIMGTAISIDLRDPVVDDGVIEISSVLPDDR